MDAEANTKGSQMSLNGANAYTEEARCIGVSSRPNVCAQDVELAFRRRQHLAGAASPLHRIKLA
jgi:hypothetical protein